jgi:hypothetical protein
MISPLFSECFFASIISEDLNSFYKIALFLFVSVFFFFIIIIIDEFYRMIGRSVLVDEVFSFSSEISEVVRVSDISAHVYSTDLTGF